MKKLLTAMFVALLMVGCGEGEWKKQVSLEERHRQVVLEALVEIRKAKESNATELNLSLVSLVSESGGNYKDLSWLTTGISDLSPLAGLTNLEKLLLSGNQITDLSPLAGLTNLKRLSLSGNQITDLSPLAGLTNLSDLYLDKNQITDLSPLAGLTNLDWLYLSENQITDISPLKGLRRVSRLRLDGNRITDVSPLLGFRSLTLKILDLQGNPIPAEQKGWNSMLKRTLRDTEINFGD